MKEIQLQLDVGTLKIYREHYRQLFKKKFDWRNSFYFEIFVGSFRYLSQTFQLHITSKKSLKADDEEVLIFNPKVELKPVLYKGKYMEIWLRESETDEILVSTE
jgi:hypothetical protein